MRIRMKISFDGTAYNGWQIQPDCKTIQGEIEAALSRLFDQPIAVTGSSRTDTGVHALGMVAHTDVPPKFELNDLEYKLNAILPEDIAVRETTEVPEDFHARYSAKGKRYEYRIVFDKSPKERLGTHRINRPEYLPKVQMILDDLAERIVGIHDFSAFARKAEIPDSPKCEITLAKWQISDSGMVFAIEGNRFLHTMVRSLVGAMLDCIRGRFAQGQFGEMLVTGERKYGYEVAPGKGLWLVEVFYD
jgi:tRNA pseudouridine38-40 synthase